MAGPDASCFRERLARSDVETELMCGAPDLACGLRRALAVEVTEANGRAALDKLLGSGPSNTAACTGERDDSKCREQA